MPEADYQVEVIVDNFVIPFYHYHNYKSSIVSVNTYFTPSISSISMNKALPGTLLTLNGNFRTSCLFSINCPNGYIDFESQNCNPINLTTNNL